MQIAANQDQQITNIPQAYPVLTQWSCGLVPEVQILPLEVLDTAS